MKSDKILAIVIIIVNVIGVFCLIYFSVPYLTHNTTIYNPDAMLPAEAWDNAGMTLTIGFIPLLIANVLAFIYLKKFKMPFRLLFFIPSIICICLVVSYLIISFI